MSWLAMPEALRNRMSGSSWVERSRNRYRESYRLKTGSSMGEGIPSA